MSEVPLEHLPTAKGVINDLSRPQIIGVASLLGRKEAFRGSTGFRQQDFGGSL